MLAITQASAVSPASIPLRGMGHPPKTKRVLIVFRDKRKPCSKSQKDFLTWKMNHDALLIKELFQKWLSSYLPRPLASPRLRHLIRLGLRLCRGLGCMGGHTGAPLCLFLFSSSCFLVESLLWHPEKPQFLFSSSGFLVESILWHPEKPHRSLWVGLRAYGSGAGLHCNLGQPGSYKECFFR